MLALTIALCNVPLLCCCTAAYLTLPRYAYTTLPKLPLLWVFPPFELVGQVIGKLVFEQTDAILIVPNGCLGLRV